MFRAANLGTVCLVGFPTLIGASIVRKSYFSSSSVRDNPMQIADSEDMVKAALGIEKTAKAHVVSGDDVLPLDIPSRDEQLKSLQTTPEYDVLVIGGGASGLGCALDASTRGLKTALVEREDFASGTSSRSTKLVHGGVRYLEAAFKNLDKSQYDLVSEAVTERKLFLTLAPHLTNEIPIMLPIYKLWQVPYFWAGCKVYDWVASRNRLTSSYYLSKRKAMEAFPMMKSKGLVGAMVYYDGQHNDSRMAVCLAVSAAEAGTNIANYTEVTKLLKNEDGKVIGASMEDRLTGRKWDVKAKCVINATGPFSDSIRKMDDPETPDIVLASAGTHIVLPDYFSPRLMGLLDPATSDGRVLFFLPWEGKTIAGTTDSKAEITTRPRPREEDIKFILKEISGYLHADVQVRRGDVLSAWSGLRPLVVDPKAKDSKTISREHVVDVSTSGLVTLAGGKWTTYRKMAEDAINAAVKSAGLPNASKCQTKKHVLSGGQAWSPTMFIRLIQDYGLDTEVAIHLSNTYGSRAYDVCDACSLSGKPFPVRGKRLVDGFPYIEAEVRFAVREYACTVTDILARRTRLAFLNVKAAEAAIPKVVEIMAKELGWGRSRKNEETQKAMEYLVQFHGLKSEKDTETEATFSLKELKEIRTLFDKIDKDRDGQVGERELGTLMASLGEEPTKDQLRAMIAEADLTQSGTIDFDEFLALINDVRSGTVTNSRLDAVMHKEAKQAKKKQKAQSRHLISGGL